MANDYVISNFDELPAPNCLFWGFKTDEAVPLDSHKTFLDQKVRKLLTELPANSSATVTIFGTCSFTGGKEYNEALGLRRAIAIFQICKDLGLTSIKNVLWAPPNTHGYQFAEISEPKPPRLPIVRERQGAIFRAVDFDVLIRPGPTPPPPPSPPKLRYFGIRTIYALSFSPPIPIAPGISIGADSMMFEIKDLVEQTCALYKYRGGNITLGLPLELLQKAATLGRLTKYVLSAPGMVSGAFAGPWNPFTHVRGPRVYKPVEQWWGAASYFQVNAFQISGLPNWMSFGGFDTKPPLRHCVRIDPYDGGVTVGFPQINSGDGYLERVSGPQPCTG